MVAGRCVPGRFCLVQLHIQKDQNELYLSRSAQTELSLAGSLAGSSTSRGIGDSWHVLSFAATMTSAWPLGFEVLDRASRSCCNLHFAIMERSVVSELGSGKSSLEGP